MTRTSATYPYLVYGLLGAMLVLAGGCQRRDGDATGQGLTVGKYVVVDTRTDQADRSRAKQNVEDALIRHGDLDCLVGLWSYNGPAILSALRDAGKTGAVKIICFDEEEDVLQGLVDGHIFGTIVQQPYRFGYESVRILAQLARGDDSVVPENGVFDVPVRVIRPEGAQAFWDELRQLKARAAEVEPGPDAVALAYLTNNTADFWKIARAGVLQAQQDFNASCQFLMPPNATAEEQKRMLESLMAKGVSGVAISPVDPANQVDMINQAAAEMNVITQDSDAPTSDRICYVGTNNYQAGREAGKLIREALPDGGKLMIFVGSLDAQNAIERRQGILDELAGKPMP